MDDTAAYTANVTIEISTPRYLRIAGDQISPKTLRDVVNKVTNKHFDFSAPAGRDYSD